MAAEMHVSLAPEPIAHIGSFVVTNSMLTAVITTVLIGGGMVYAARQIKLHPAGGFAGAIEALIETLLDQMVGVFGSRQRALQYFPFLATIFLFILGNNWFAQLPGFNTITIGEVPLFRAVTADLSATIALALISVILTQVYAIRELGVIGNLRRYFSSNPMMNILGVQEIILESTRVISFSFRLFGNIFAGEVLLIVISALLPLLGPTPFWGLEIFVGFIQALVFTMLTMVFIAMSTSHEAAH
ncbi:F0F1 ATP synthase subunit A [Patescibacteria group bacterium]|nr:MAG: F0F1 ATP synthase subunit A [Patescibacteria group bacterium]